LGESSDTEAIHAHFCPNLEPIYQANLARQPEQVGPRPHVLRRGMHRLRDVLGLDTEVQQLLHGCGLVEVAQPFALDVLNSSCLQTTSHHWVANTTNAFDLDFHDIPFL